MYVTDIPNHPKRHLVTDLYSRESYQHDNTLCLCYLFVLFLSRNNLHNITIDFHPRPEYLPVL